MMMISGLIFAASLFALAGGIGLLVWSMRNEGAGVGVAKVFGYIISILSIFIIVFTLYSVFEMKKMMRDGCSMCNMMPNKCMMNNSDMTDSKQNMMPDSMNKQGQSMPNSSSYQ